MEDPRLRLEKDIGMKLASSAGSPEDAAELLLFLEEASDLGMPHEGVLLDAVHHMEKCQARAREACKEAVRARSVHGGKRLLDVVIEADMCGAAGIEVDIARRLAAEESDMELGITCQSSGSAATGQPKTTDQDLLQSYTTTNNVAQCDETLLLGKWYAGGNRFHIVQEDAMLTLCVNGNHGVLEFHGDWWYAERRSATGIYHGTTRLRFVGHRSDRLVVNHKLHRPEWGKDVVYSRKDNFQPSGVSASAQSLRANGIQEARGTHEGAVEEAVAVATAATISRSAREDTATAEAASEAAVATAVAEARKEEEAGAAPKTAEDARHGGEVHVGSAASAAEEERTREEASAAAKAAE